MWRSFSDIWSNSMLKHLRLRNFISWKKYSLWLEDRLAAFEFRKYGAMEEVFLSFLLKVYIAQIECSDCRSFPRPFSIQISACLLKHHFYRGSHSKMASKEHCMCIKQKQNISSRSFCAALRLLSHLFNLYGSKEIVGKIQNDLVPIILVYLQWGAILPHSLWRNFQLKQSPLHCWKQPCGVQGLAIRFL